MCAVGVEREGRCLCSGHGLGKQHVVQWMWPSEGKGDASFCAWKTKSVFHPRKFNGIMEVAAIQMGGVNVRYTAQTRGPS